MTHRKVRPNFENW